MSSFFPGVPSASEVPSPSSELHYIGNRVMHGNFSGKGYDAGSTKSVIQLSLPLHPECTGYPE